MTETSVSIENVSFESENDDSASKTKRKSNKLNPKRKYKLSLNSENKSKGRLKDDVGNQTSIASFFKTMSPTVEENGNYDQGKKENCLVVANRCESENDDSAFTKEIIKKKQSMKIKKVNKKLNKSQEISLDVDESLVSESIEDDDSKKVRFSENIQEYSPELLQKKVKYNIESEKQEVEIIEVTSRKNKVKIENAFAFMMDSRHRSIGQNSIGQDVDKEKMQELDELQIGNKKRLSVRKAMFQEWADKKGGKEKRLKEKEKGLIIEKKLNKRAKRLKKMLTHINFNGDESNERIVKKKTKVKPIESDSETETQLSEKKRKRKTISSEVLSMQEDGNALDEEIFSHHKKSKLVFPKDSENQKSCSNSSLLHQTELSNFFDTLNKEVQPHSPNKAKSKLQMKQNIAKGTLKTSKLTLKKQEKNSSETVIPEIGTKSNQNDLVFIDNLNSTQTGTIEQQNEDDYLTDRTKMQEILTPRSFKKWKMRLKVNIEDIDDNEIERLIQPCTHTKKKLMNEELITVSDSDSNNEPLPSMRCKIKELNDDKSIKLAPLFVRSKPKPKLDQEAVEARRKFLHSEIPKSLKKTLKQQTNSELVEHSVFPLISHIMTKPTMEELTNSTINYWNLPNAYLKFKTYKVSLPSLHKPFKLGSFTSAISNSNNINNDLQLKPPQKISHLNIYLKQIKNDNPDYPVYKAFNSLYKKSSFFISKADQPKIQEVSIDVKKRKRRRKKKNDIEIVTPTPTLLDPSQQEIWTDLYKPSTSEEIFGNHTAITQLKSWLKSWLTFSEEINAQRNCSKHTGSDSDFETEEDADSKDGMKLLGNTVLLCGPHGSGKTMSVYALCNEFGINVLELNASSKRTGKSLLQELQEATQSHQVRKKDMLTSFINKNEDSSKSSRSSSQNSDSQSSHSSQSSKKMCLLLIEDVDIVFNQDDNFINALSQLLATSKRPIILTTTDSNCLHLKRFFTQHKVIHFNALSARILSVWLQILCLLEGLYVNKNTLDELIEFYKGDVRCTLIQLQFWVRSGGQSSKKMIENSTRFIQNDNLENSGEEYDLIKDDSSNISWLNNESENILSEKFEHSGYPESFTCFKNCPNELFSTYPIDLGNLWWNLPNLLGIPLPLIFNSNKENVNVINQNDNAGNIESLKNISNIFNTLAMTDVTYKKLNINCGDGEPVQTNCRSKIINSLELNECMECYSLNRDLTNSLFCHLLNGNINIYNRHVEQRFPVEDSIFVEGKRWRSKQYKCDRVFQDAIPLVCNLNHNSLHVDYLSTLRTIGRSEIIRASNNNKRRNRFYNYLRGVGVKCNDSLFKTACNVFHQESECSL